LKHGAVGEGQKSAFGDVSGGVVGLSALFGSAGGRGFAYARGRSENRKRLCRKGAIDTVLHGKMGVKGTNLTQVSVSKDRSIAKKKKREPVHKGGWNVR